jgi:hypothetical protein
MEQTLIERNIIREKLSTPKETPRIMPSNKQSNTGSGQKLTKQPVRDPEIVDYSLVSTMNFNTIQSSE